MKPDSPFRPLAELLFVIHAFLMLLVVVDVAKHEAEKIRQAKLSTPAVHAR